jgi:Domain of unknown function (DUF4365)
MAKLRRKRRTREHVLAEMSVNHVQRQVLRCGWLVEEIRHDYGLDLELFTFDKKGDVQEGTVYLQLKGVQSLPLRHGAETFPFRIERRDLVYWLAQPLPVILVVYDAKKDTAYWLYVQSYFGRQKSFNLFRAGKTVTVRVPRANVVSPAAVRQFGRFRDRVLEQISELIHDETTENPLS